MAPKGPSRPSDTAQLFSGSSPKPNGSRRDLSISQAVEYASLYPLTLPEQDIIAKFGLTDTPVGANTDPLLLHRTDNFTGYDHSGLHRNPEELKRQMVCSLYKQVFDTYDKLKKQTDIPTIEQLIIINIDLIKVFLENSGGESEYKEMEQNVFMCEQFLLTQLKFLNLRDLMQNIVNGNFENEAECRRIFGECFKSPLLTAFRNEFEIIKDFLAFLKDSRSVDFKMSNLLQEFRNYSENEILNIPFQLYVEFLDLLAQFNDVLNRMFPFEFNNPIRPETIDTLEKYWSAFIEMLFGNLVNNIPVNYSQREYLQKKHDLMKLFASKAPCSQDEKILQRLKEFESFLDVYDKKLKAISLLEKILCGKTNIQKNATNEKILKFSIGLVFSCERSKTELRRRIMEVGDGNAAILLQETDKKKLMISFYQVLGWL